MSFFYILLPRLVFVDALVTNNYFGIFCLPLDQKFGLTQNIKIRVDEPENITVKSCPFRDRRKGLEKEFSNVWAKLAWPKNCETKHHVR